MVISLCLLKGKFVQCDVLDPPKNGQVQVKSRQSGSIAHYTCDNGHRLIGYDRRECLESGQWSMEPPECLGRHSEYSLYVSHVLINVLFSY